MLTLEQIIERLRDRNLSEVSRKTGVYYLTLTNIASGKTKNPTYKSVIALSEYLK